MKGPERIAMRIPAEDLIPCPPIPLNQSDCTKIPEGLETFTFGRFRFDFIAQEEFSLPRYKGSVFRGGFGLALKRISCSQGRRGPCPECILCGECAYARVFETPVRPGDTGMIEGMSDAPHPMILRPPMPTKRLYKAGDPLDVEIILIGQALRFVPHVICAFEDFSRMGFGEGKGKFEMQGVSAFFGGKWNRVYSEGDRLLEQRCWTLTGIDQLEDVCGHRADCVELKVHTPMRIKWGGSITDDLRFDLLIRNILRRIQMLDQLHCQGTIRFDHERLIALAAHVETIFENLWWTDWSRHSKRRNAEIMMGGVIGEIVFSGELTEFLPYLKLGEILHVGKGTAYGMGRYSMRILGGENTFGYKSP